MTRKFKYCVKCRRNITLSELERGLFVETDNGLLCATCAQQLDEDAAAAETPHKSADAPSAASLPEPVSPDPGESAGQSATDNPAPLHTAHHDSIRLLTGIKEQMETIHRTMFFEKTSAWNVLGGVAQVFAAGFMVAAAVMWLENPVNLLMVSLVFQVMALAFFVKGK